MGEDPRRVSPEVAIVVDGRREESTLLAEAPQLVTVEIDDARHRCRSCRAAVSQDPHNRQWMDEDGLPYCPQAHDQPEGVTRLRGGPHDPQTMPFGWCEDIAVEFDEESDRIRVTMTLRGRGGQLRLAVEHVADDDIAPELADRLLVRVPHPGDESWTMTTLVAVRPGTYTID